jgi:2-(1,2-epoxy-1,2-dihydrophenyl)acetyl-CoA isomerase
MTVLSELHASVLTLTLERPRVNAFNLEMVGRLRELLRSAETDGQVRCLVLTGSGGVFSAGHDVGEMLAADSQFASYREHLQATYNPLILQIRHIPKPVIAAVNGPAAGAGLGVALACDLRLAADTASFTVGFARIGLAPDSGVSLFLPILVGLGRAAELAFSNTAIPAEQAFAWGLVNRVVPAADLASEVRVLAESLAAGPTGAFGLTKQAFNRAVLPHLEAALEHEAQLQETASRGQEHREGVAAFLEKRPPVFE